MNAKEPPHAKLEETPVAKLSRAGAAKPERETSSAKETLGPFRDRELQAQAAALRFPAWVGVPELPVYPHRQFLKRIAKRDRFKPPARFIRRWRFAPGSKATSP